MNKTLLVVNLLSAQIAVAIEFYDSPIDYWKKEDVIAKDTNTKDPKIITEVVSTSVDEEFEWKEYLNPKNDKFYTGAKEIRLHVLKNPTKDNIARLKAWENASVEKYLNFSGNYSAIENKTTTLKKKYIEKNTPISLKNLDITLFYESTCPYCKSMIAQLDPYFRSGLKVQLVKVDDREEKIRTALPKRAIKEGEAILSGLSKNGKIAVPYMLITNRKTNKTSIYRGYQNIKELL